VRADDLNGSIQDKCDTALLLIDVINDLDFPESKQLLRFALPMAERLRQLKIRAKRAGIPAIYINDNFGRWQSDFRALVEYCFQSKGERIARLLKPDVDDYFVLKPRHSAFYSTSLDVLLRHLGATKLIITGIAANICVLFSANDAYMRQYELMVPQDCVASNTAADNRYAIRQMATLLKADVRPSTRLRLTSSASPHRDGARPVRPR
jgi:nicotinamidase-related amidase